MTATDQTSTDRPASSARGRGRGRRDGAATTPFRALSVAMLKSVVREKVTLFFAFLFPLMFLVIFGLLFGDRTAAQPEIGVVGDGPVIAALEESQAIQLVRVEDADRAEQQVREGELPAYVSQDGDTVQVRFSAGEQDSASTVVGIVDGIVNRVNIAETGQQPRFALDAQQVEDASLEPIQYMAPGIMTWAVAMGAVFGAAITLVNWRRNQVLRRLRLAPVRPTTVLNSRLFVTLGMAAAQALIFVAVASLPVFGLQLTGQWWLAIPLLLMGTLSFFAIGMLVGAWCRTEESASTVSNVVTLPMAFLSGAFFPMDLAPSWLQQVSFVLPMRHLNDGMLAVMVRGQGVEALVVPMLVLLGFTVVVGALAAKLFRWEP